MSRTIAPSITNVAILNALRSVIDLPANIVSLKLEMGIDRLPTLEVEHHAEVETTHLESTAREHALAAKQTKRFELRELP